MWRPRSGGRIDAHTDNPQNCSGRLAAAKAVPNGPELYANAPMRLGELLADEPAALLQSANTDFVKKGRPLPVAERRKPFKGLALSYPHEPFCQRTERASLRTSQLIATIEPRRRPILAQCAAKTTHEQLNSVKQHVPHGRILPDPIV